jgi:hypothetical protein
MDRQYRPIYARDTPLPQCSETAKKTAKLAKKLAKAIWEQANPEATCLLDV